MEKDFVQEMDLDRTVKLDKPFVVILSGLPGSGKSHLARQLSKNLKIYLLSSDYIRNYYYQFTKDYSEKMRKEIEKKVSEINENRIRKLIGNKISFVLDKDLNKKEYVDKFLKDYNIEENYKIVKIKINSSDENNIERILNRKMNYNEIDSDIIGDNISYQSSFSKEVYYEIKERKPQELLDSYFDHVIDNNGTIEEFENQINYLINNIKI